MKKLKEFYDWIIYHNTSPNEKPSAFVLMLVFAIIALSIFGIICIIFPWVLLTIPASAIVWAWKDFNKDNQ